MSTQSPSVKAAALHHRLSARGARPARGIGVHNALGARIAEGCCVEFLWLSGLEVSAAFGLPDASLITMTELLETSAMVARSTALPLLVDGDTGFGGPNNVRRLVLECERAGASGVCIEDKRFPKVNSFHKNGHELEPIEVFVEKITTALCTRTDPNFVVVARTEAMIAGAPVGEAVRRARAYCAAGADAVFVHSRVDTVTELATFFAAFGTCAPVIVSPTTYWSVTEAELQRLGATAVLYSNVGVRLAAKAMAAGIGALVGAGTLASIQEQMVSLSELRELQEVRAWSL
jgi:phosphoenolpyruvate phosphomutase